MGEPLVYDRNVDMYDSVGLHMTGKILVAVTMILFFITASVLAIYFFFKSLEHDHDEQHRHRHLHFTQGQPASALRNKLDTSVLDSIPVLIFSTKDFKEAIECAVCLSETVDGEKIRILPKCNHGFHIDCIDMWFQSNSTCPVCRNLVSDQPDLKTETDNTLEVTTIRLHSAEPLDSASSSLDVRPDGVLVIDIPTHIDEDELETRSPIVKQLRSFKRMLSMGTTRVSPSSSGTDPRKIGPELC